MARLAANNARAGSRWSFTRFRRNEDGATAVEFGLIALPFIALMLATIETALVFFAGQTMENAVDMTSRLIRTGQAQQNGFSADDFKAQVCSRLLSLMNCETGLYLDVKTYKTFDAIDLSDPVDGDGNLKKDFGYEPGHGSDIVVVRAFYQWPVYVNMLGHNLDNMGNGTHLLTATTAFRNEPFPW
ncbi:MAG: pilus assembly protein [Bauldia sp.]|nr:pilus assembly protein [Bauldia sp.]